MSCSRLLSFCSVLLAFAYTNADITLNYDHDLKHIQAKRYDIKGTITLDCRIKHAEGYRQKWEKDMVEIKPEADTRMHTNNEGHSYVLKISKATEDDAGVYSCIIMDKGVEVERANITLLSKYRVKTPDNLNFVEGEKLRIPCAVYGKPTPIISWQIGNTTYQESTDRILLEKDEEKNVPNAILVIKEAEMSDRGEYICIGTPGSDLAGDNDGMLVSDKTIIRIKDKYAALWPFLGICAEVFILCAIILIYEKKRNKAELEESDTDQSPDQKNTPDHGKDSNLRHRQQ